MEKLEQILLTCNFQKRVAKPKVTFEEVESIIKFKLPEDYKFFALNYLEFEDFIGPEYVRLWNAR